LIYIKKYNYLNIIWQVFTINEARREVPKRLLEMNQKIQEEEVKAGLWDEKKTKKGNRKIPI